MNSLPAAFRQKTSGGMAAVVDGIALLLLHARIDDGDDLVAARLQIRRFRSPGSRKCSLDLGEDAVAVHVVDVQPQAVVRELVLVEIDPPGMVRSSVPR